MTARTRTHRLPLWLGRIICAIRARLGRRPVHDMRRRYKDNFTTVKICARCGYWETVKPRKRKGAV